MSKFLRVKLNLLTFEGLPPTNNPKDAIEIDQKVEDNVVSEVSRVQKTIPGSTTDMVLNLADSGANDYLMILVDQQVSIKLNGDSTAITLNPKAAGIKTPVFMLRGINTSLTISNAGTVAANIDFVSVKI